MDWPTAVLGLGVCALIAFLAGWLPELLQDIGDTVPVADLRPEPEIHPNYAITKEEALLQYRERLQAAQRERARAHALGYEKGYHDACLGLPKDLNNGSGVITVEQADTLSRMRESKWYREHEARWTGDTNG